jgi:hypothetical protein
MAIGCQWGLGKNKGWWPSLCPSVTVESWLKALLSWIRKQTINESLSVVQANLSEVTGRSVRDLEKTSDAVGIILLVYCFPKLFTLILFTLANFTFEERVLRSDDINANVKAKNGNQECTVQISTTCLKLQKTKMFSLGTC